MEYLLIHKKGQQFFYELQYQGEGEYGNPFVMNLIDVTTLGYDPERSGLNSLWSGCGRPVVGMQSGGGRSEKNPAKAESASAEDELPQINGKTHNRIKNITASYRSNRPVAGVQ